MIVRKDQHQFHRRIGRNWCVTVGNFIWIPKLRSRHAHSFDLRPAAHRRLVGQVFVHRPGSDDARSNQLVAELGESIVRVRLQCVLEALVGAGSLAFPPLDDAKTRENRGCVGAVGPGVKMEQELLSTINSLPVGWAFCLAEQQVA